MTIYEEAAATMRELGEVAIQQASRIVDLEIENASLRRECERLRAELKKPPY